MKAIPLYMPVIHQGYLSFLDRHLPADVFLLSPKSLIESNPVMAEQLTRDIRAVPISTIKKLLDHLYPGQARVYLFEGAENLKEYYEIVMPSDDISRILLKHLPWAKIHLDTVFLRWDWSKSTVPIKVEGIFPISTDENDRLIMAMAGAYAGKSSDVWRHVGAAVKFPGNEIVMGAFNEHLPNAHAPYVNGDPRLHMKPGERPDICTAIHAEQQLIAQAAKEGKAVNGLSIYVTTFPCAVCARAIWAAGFKKLFYKEGYSNLDAAEVLTKGGIEIFQVK
jgi:dCMP deaminase